MELSIWDGADAVMDELNRQDEPRRRRVANIKATRRRGGLGPLAEKASLATFGMSLADLDREAARTLPSKRELEAALEAVRVVAGYDPDHAAVDNRLGFARPDVAIGHALASAPASTAITSPGLALLVWRRAMRYRRQVSPRLSFAAGFTDQSDLFN